MNEVINNILQRRSVRSFITDKDISKEDLETIAKAGVYAPSGMNKQAWQFTVIQNQQIITKLCNLIANALKRENYDMYKPNAIIITSFERENSDLGELDCACALENMFLAAQSLGIGSVWINQLRACCNEKEVRDFLTDLGIPENHDACGICAMGYNNNYEKQVEKNLDNIKWVK